MPIKVCYDITMLGKYFSYIDAKMGIYRVIEEILLELLKNEELEITLSGICSTNSCFSSINCSLYAQNCLNNYSYKFDNTFKSKLKLEWFYNAICKTYFSKKFQKLPKYSLKSIWIRGIIKIIESTELYKYDCHQNFNHKNYDILHSTYEKLPSERLTKKLPRLLTIYDLIPVKSPIYVSPRRTDYYKQILDSIRIQKDWITCISDYTRQEFCEYINFPIERTFVSPLAADKQFSPVNNIETIQTINRRYNIETKPYFLCLASQLNYNKNIPHLITSFVVLITEQPSLDINLVLIGTTRHKRLDIEQTLEKFPQYRDRIIVTGYVPDEDLSAIYSGAMAFVFPSLYEGFGLPVLEAMQCGTPVISSNSTSLPEVVGNAGILIDPKDQDQLCQAMLNVLTDESLRESLKQKGLERAKEFSWQKCADQTINIYKTILDSQ